MDDKIHQLIFQAVDQTISDDDFQRLQDLIESDDEVRDAYLRAVGLCESLGDIAASDDVDDSDRDAVVWRFTVGRWAIAASILIMVSVIAFWLGQRNVPRSIDTELVEHESLIAGHATLRRSVDLRWATGFDEYHDGDVLPDGTIAFDEGVAEIDFFCGATLIVEGPARLDIESDWIVHVAHGRLRANVPPAARGFIVKAAGSQIVDLGTEFALDVGADAARLEVIDGEVELRGGEHDGSFLTTGQGQWLKGSSTQSQAFDELTTINDLLLRRDTARAERFTAWKQHTLQRRLDDRLIAYFPFTETQSGRMVRNAASTGSVFDGRLVGSVNRMSGRFGPESTGFEFDRPGARIRTRIDGTFQAFTFTCWVRIDSLEHRYNALFMGDGYENGEPHWQIRDDGKLMLSVMVDDTQDVRYFNKSKQREVKDAGLHRVYFTPPFWDISKSGQWFQIVSVYDPAARVVDQYVNGDRISSEPIIDKFYTEDLRIGPAEIGNWGQPFRKTPWFAVRNLNGTIDELAIYKSALSESEIENLYEQGKPLGY